MPLLLLAGLAAVDLVVPFDDETPRDLIIACRPDVLVKGGDYTAATTAGASEVIAAGIQQDGRRMRQLQRIIRPLKEAWKGVPDAHAHTIHFGADLTTHRLAHCELASAS